MRAPYEQKGQSLPSGPAPDRVVPRQSSAHGRRPVVRLRTRSERRAGLANLISPGPLSCRGGTKTLPMRLLVLAAAAVAAAATALGALTIAGAVPAEDKTTEKYSDAYDDLDVDAILKDDAERDRYYGCFMDTGPCHNAVARFFKSKAPEAIVTGCKYCTRRQLQMFDKIVGWYVENRPQEWHVLIEKTIQDARKRGL